MAMQFPRCSPYYLRRGLPGSSPALSKAISSRRMMGRSVKMKERQIFTPLYPHLYLSRLELSEGSTLVNPLLFPRKARFGFHLHYWDF